ncbi:Predicted 5' DNA nuclease, flap endonuclease-1-like, helix-3-turn-helix (H3TH) domain [Filomicrobium insigne]|uniref:Predicted 5' DNA nuclease, flap endonuclease-1-like, helix-3-turn-helix (H3TH) domain n=1 Tax=Filomicrobium insigne TaxID=418854 RepID=A0A1H0IEC7_9HYPH|nr:hypothetical protein [Filomicrobium insigne]SDO29696.1 Predicted 5' DNA nuclease, flap endonuclease-1-like, helix-3-turn-helix (H3TH) domain [Filomicrobium insigne]
MSSDLAQARGALVRDLANLEELLSADSDWQALRDFEKRTGRNMTAKLDGAAEAGLPEGVCNALKGNSLFLARARILEALDLLQADTARADRSAADEPFQPSFDLPVIEPDDLTRIRGITPSIATHLRALGATAYEKIAAWSADDVATVAEALNLGNTISRQNWIEQAALLAIRNGRAIAKPLSKAHLQTTAALQPVDRIDDALARLVCQAKALPLPNIPSPIELTSAEETETFQPDAPVPSAPPAFLPIVDETGDDLRHIAFIDDKVAANLNSLGILKFSDIAHFTVDQVAMVSVRFGLGNRISREQWIEQAAVLATGCATAYARRVKAGETASLHPAPPPVQFPADGSAQSTPANPVVSEVTPPPLPQPPPLASASTAHLQPAEIEHIQPPPLPEYFAELADQYPRQDYEAYEEDTDEGVSIISRAQPAPRVRRMPTERPAKRWAHADGPLLRNPSDWEPIEEAAVEIVPRSPPFPGVGPVQHAASRLQSAVDTPAPALSRLLRVLQRR